MRLVGQKVNRPLAGPSPGTVPHAWLRAEARRMPSRGCHSLNAYQRLGALGWAVHTRCKSVTSSLQSYETGAIILPIAQMRPLRHREMKFAQGPVGCGWQSWVLNPTSLTSAPRLFRPLVNDQGAGLRALGPWAHLCCMRWGTPQGGWKVLIPGGRNQLGKRVEPPSSRGGPSEDSSLH